MVEDISYWLFIVTFISFLGNGFAEEIQLTSEFQCRTYRMSKDDVNYLTWDGDKYCPGDDALSSCEVTFDANNLFASNFICIEKISYDVPCQQKTVKVQYRQGTFGSANDELYGCNEQPIGKWCTPSYTEEARVKIETSGFGDCNGNSFKLKISAIQSDTGDILDNTFGLVKTTIYIIVGCVIGGIVLIIVVVVIIICCCCRNQNRGSTQGVVYQPAQGATVATPNPYQHQPMTNAYQPQPMATGYPPPSTEYPPPKAGY